jgi:ATP-binding cassette, subfamily B, bacterial PglK
MKKHSFSITYSTIKSLWTHIPDNRKFQLSLILLLMVLSSLAEIISISSILPFLSALSSPVTLFNHPIAKPAIIFFKLSSPNELLAPLTFFFALAAVSAGTIRIILIWSQTRLGYAIGADLSIKIYRNVLFKPYLAHVNQNSSDIIAGVTIKAEEIVYNIVIPMLNIINSFLMIIILLIALFVIQPIVTISAIISFVSIYVLVIFATQRNIFKASQIISLQKSLLIKILQESLGGIRDIIIDGSQNFYCTLYRQGDRLLRHAQANITIISISPRYIIESLGMALIAVMAYFLAIKSDGLNSVIPVIGALALGAQKMLPLLQQFYSGWTSIRGSQASLIDTLDLLNQPIKLLPDSTNLKPLLFEREIIFENIKYRYSKDRPWVIDGLNLKISKGDMVGIIGTTGCGKSTLLDILMGLLTPLHGKICVDGTIITEKEHKAWQKHIAHVPQSIFLADRSILENIAFGVPITEIDFDCVKRAAKSAQLESIIESWPDRYNTIIGERGVRLSGGQRQRIGIARALYKKADLIIFDEATSALDSTTELAVMNSIKDLINNATVVIVAHRMTTLKDCTQIVELANGKVSRTGSYEKIILSI